MGKKLHPQFKNMNEKEIKAWEEKMRYLEGDNKNADAANQINQGRGWIF